jgi:LPXTG-motif cell wall-anchored protein
LYDNSLHDNKNAIICYNKALYFASLLLKNTSAVGLNSVKIQIFITYNNIANVYVKSGLYDSAEKYFQKAFSQIDVSFNENNFYDKISIEVSKNKSIFPVIYGLLDVGESLLKEYKAFGGEDRLQKAAWIFKAADKLQFQHHIDQTDVQSKLFWRNLLHRLYELGIETAYLLGNKDAAFQYFEKSRAVLLYDQLSTQQLFSNNEIFKLAQLNKKILNLSRDLNTEHDSSGKYKSLQDEIFTNNQELNTLEQSIKNKNPIFYQTILDTNSINLKDVQNTILKNQDVLLEIFNGDSAVYVIMLTPKQCFLNKIDKKDYDNTADLYTSLISDQVLVNRKYDQYLLTASHLYELIFQKYSVPKGRIIISPDGKYFPFEALIQNRNNLTPVYFLNDHVVSYTYSARFLLNDFSKSNITTRGNLLGLAPVKYPAAFQLSTLPNSDVSLEKISSYCGKTFNLTGSLASKSNFLQLYTGYKIIQLYTHASDASSNGEPVIYFADSALYLSELIAEDKTAAQLIVLSACETGNGKLYEGEGVFSFNRGFAALGIPSSVINLWSVENESTYKITELFYKYAAEGLPLDIALQKAKLEFIASSSKEKKLPYYWAAAILAGKTDAIEMSTGFNWKWAALIGGLLIISLIFFFSKKKKYFHH